MNVGLLYYLPLGYQDVKPGALIEAGLRHAFDPRHREHATSRGVTRGPAGPGGSIIVDAAAVPTEHFGYWPDRQKWRVIPGSKAWVGFYPDMPPMPETLARAVMLQGHPVTLCDGNVWHAPIARGHVEEDGELRYTQRLPARSVLGDDGKWGAGEALPQYAHLWPIATAWFDSRMRPEIEEADADADGAVRVKFDFDGGHEAAIAALGANYRLGPAECDLLGLLSARETVAILDALIDWQTWLAWAQKKVATAGLNIGDGPAVEAPGIAQPSPT